MIRGSLAFEVKQIIGQPFGRGGGARRVRPLDPLVIMALIKFNYGSWFVCKLTYKSVFCLTLWYTVCIIIKYTVLTWKNPFIFYFLQLMITN